MSYALSGGVRLSFMDEWGIAYAFVSETNRLWMLNRTSAYVLSAILEGAPEDEIDAEVGRLSGLEPAAAAAAVREAIEQLAERAIIQGGGVPVR